MVIESLIESDAFLLGEGALLDTQGLGAIAFHQDPGTPLAFEQYFY